jgi:hypothetical protein
MTTNQRHRIRIDQTGKTTNGKELMLPNLKVKPPIGRKNVSLRSKKWYAIKTTAASCKI